MTFRDETQHQKAIGVSFETLLRSILDKREMVGRQGVQYSEKGYTGSMYMLETEMTPEVFSLGCAMKNMQGVTPEAWAAWMSDVEFYENPDEVCFFCRSEFFLSGAKQRFGNELETHFKKKLVWNVSQQIKNRVNKRVA
jgi:hypothetical protein